MLVAATGERSLSDYRQNRPLCRWPLGAAICLVAGVYGFGLWTLQEHSSSGPTARVVLIQGSFDTEFDGDPYRMQEAFETYRQLSLQAVGNHQGIDLLIWPESMFLGRSIVRHDADVTSPADGPDDFSIPDAARFYETMARQTISEIGTECLVGTDAWYYHVAGTKRYNTAAFYRRDGTLVTMYHKMHPVMFGEYVPLGNAFPWLYTLTPMPGGLSAGNEPISFQAGGLWFSPCICFENTVPHLIRRQVLTLQRQGNRVDALVTITNDGWFWGSSLLDIHLACGVFRAIENRKPMLIAANTGFSAWIDEKGHILAQGPRRDTGIIVADVIGDPSATIYTRYGDWFAGTCLAGLLVGLVYSWRR